MSQCKVISKKSLGQINSQLKFKNFHGCSSPSFFLYKEMMTQKKSVGIKRVSFQSFPTPNVKYLLFLASNFSQSYPSAIQTTYHSIIHALRVCNPSLE